MSYVIRKTDGTLLVDLADGVKDSTHSPLFLIGKNVSDFGQSQNQNFVYLLENFASTFAPSHSLTGQLWFDTSSNQLNVKTSNGFVPIGPFSAPTTPTAGDSSTSLATTEFVHKILPKGSVILWYGNIEDIPQGWALCNGQTVNGLVTPDLTSRFVMGAGASVGRSQLPGWVGYGPGDTGGTPAISNVPVHSHSFSATSSDNNVDHSHGGTTTGAGVHYHGMPGDDQLAFANGVAGWTSSSMGGFGYDARSVSGGGGQVWQTTSAGSHNHTFNTGGQSTKHYHTVDGNTSAAGNASVDVLNPYYALAYIVKVI